MNADTLKDTDNFTNSKRDIKADNYNKTKIFTMENDENQSLSRVNSQNYPDATNNLDSLADKLRLNKQKNKSTPTRSKLNKLEKCPEEKIDEKGLSNSFHHPSDKLMPEIITNTNEDLQKVSSKKNKFMANILRRLSISTPKIFSKNKKHKKSKHNSDKKAATIDRTTINMSTNLDSIFPIKNENGNKLINGVDEKNSTELSPHSKSIRKILQKLTRKKEKGKINSEPPSSIESRPSLSSVVNNGLNFETTTSCNNIYLNKLCKDELQKYNCSSADCILDIQKRGENSINHRESVSSNSDDMKEHEDKLNAVVNTIPHDTVSDEFHNLETSSTHVDGDKISPLSIKTTEFKFDTQRSCHSTLSNGYQPETSHNVKLTLALYGYCNYGLSSSRLASKSCIEFRSANRNKKAKSIENVSAKELVTLSKSSESHEKSMTSKTESESKEVVDVNSEISNLNDSVTIRQKEEANDQTDQSSVVLRKSQRPKDIKLRKSREPSQNMVARSSMIMLVVSHNSPRAKIVSNQLTTPNKDIDLNGSINGSLSTNIPAMKLNFENFSNNEHKIIENGVPFTTLDEVRKSITLSTTLDGIKLDNKISENGFKESNETMDGNYFLDLVHKYEMEILMKIDIVQKYIDDPQLKFDDEVSGQLMVTVGKAKLLLSEKMLQFKGLCEKNISGIIEENELPTLSSDLNGFWDMVFGQIEDINRNFVIVEKIRSNGWKMIPYELEEKSLSNTPTRTRKVTGTKSANANHSTPMKKKSLTPADIAAQNKTIAEKRKNMMLFKLNQKASMAQKPDSSFSEDITFY